LRSEAPNSVRRIVTIDDDNGKSVAIHDGPTPDVRTDPARPGFASMRIWVTDTTPASVAHVRDPLTLPHTLEPPQHGSVCRIVTVPPDAAFLGKVGGSDVAAFFRAMGSPAASTYSPQAPHPYMQKTRTLDFCLILEGEITLVLDTAEVQLAAGDTVVQRGTNHAWSNRSDRPCTIAISSHDAAD
jgi:mannose-6-phosphate isomerase-like protein (cupin superfamily)